MCEFKGNEAQLSSEGKMILNVATIEADNATIANPHDESLPVVNHKNIVYFEKALEETKFGKFNYLIILVCGLILSNVLLETLGMGFVLPVSQCDLNLSLQQRGILSAIGFAGIISSSHLWGFLADTTGRRYIIRPTLLLGFVATIISSFATNFWLLVILRYINGFCISGGSATSYVYLGEFHTTKNRSRAIMGAAFIFGIGAILLPGIAWLVINQDWRLELPMLGLTYKPWRLFIVVCGIPGLLCGLALFFIPESPKFLLSRGEEERVLKILRNMYARNTGKSSDSYPIGYVMEDLDNGTTPMGRSLSRRSSMLDRTGRNPLMELLRSMWSQTAPLFNRRYIRITTLICVIQFWIFVTSNGLYMWFPHILNNVAEYTAEQPNGRIRICDIVYQKQASIFQEIQMNTMQPNIGGNNATTTTATTSIFAKGECNEKLEIATYERTLLLEVLYAVGFAIIGFIINKLDKMIILFICLTFCGICGIITILVDIPSVATYLYLILLLCGLGINVLGAATVDLYPTRLRAMAVCISLMMGRLGSVVGANVVSALLSSQCESAFVFCGVTLMISGCLGFLIPKPDKLSGKNNIQRRTSIVSMVGN